MIPLVYTVGDDRLKSDVHYVVDTVLNRVQPDGRTGPETLSGGKRLIWARTLLSLRLMNLVEANAMYEQPHRRCVTLFPWAYEFHA